jgi:hypothetical protein
MKKTVCGLGLVVAVALASMAGSAQARTDGEKTVAGIGERLRASDCEGAVKALNGGLRAGYPEVALLAGTMFEAGFCLNKNWNKAVGFYTQAHDGGVKEGALRLAAGFAAAANGPDTAAALWWAKRAGLKADYCTGRLPDADDPDRFVQTLRTWPVGDLQVCNFVVGMMSFISAEGRYPMAGISHEIKGRIDLVFTPAMPHFALTAPDANATSSDVLTTVFSRTAGFAGARYLKPVAISPSWQIPFSLDVDTDKSRWW